MLGKRVGDRLDHFRRAQHAGLDCVRTNVVEAGENLFTYDRGRYRMDRANGLRVLHGYSGHGRHRIGAKRGSGLDVRLDTGAARIVRARNNEKANGLARHAAASSIAEAISLTTALISFSSSPSAITRMTGSVPDLRTRMRPEPLRRASQSLIRAATRSSSSGAPLRKRTFFITW